MMSGSRPSRRVTASESPDLISLASMSCTLLKRSKLLHTCACECVFDQCHSVEGQRNLALKEEGLVVLVHVGSDEKRGGLDGALNRAHDAARHDQDLQAILLDVAQFAGLERL